MAEEKTSQSKTVAVNRKARFDYFIESEVEAGLVLTGTEVKSLRGGRANIADAYAGETAGELWLINANIPEFKGGNRYNHEPLRHRKLLLKKKELNKLLGQIRTKGVTLIPLTLYFNSRGICKVKIGLAKVKKEFEKRDTIKQREWDKEKRGLLKAKNKN